MIVSSKTWSLKPYRTVGKNQIADATRKPSEVVAIKFAISGQFFEKRPRAPITANRNDTSAYTTARHAGRSLARAVSAMLSTSWALFSERPGPLRILAL